MVISTHTVVTTPVGFAPCWWPATSAGSAEQLAKDLSEKSDRSRYPNAFWVIDENDRANAICKFYQGERYSPSDAV